MNPTTSTMKSQKVVKIVKIRKVPRIQDLPGMKQGKILVTGIKFHGYHGLTRIEREIGVRYSVDVEMTCDLAAAARTDRVQDTIDYRDVHHLVIEVGKSNSYRLIETLASRIVDAVLARTRAAVVLVRVRKETPILDGIVDAVSVELEQERKIK